MAFPMKANKKSFDQMLDSYEKVKNDYENFKRMRKKLGIPERSIFNIEVIRGNIEGKEFLEAVKLLKKKKGESVNV